MKTKNILVVLTVVLALLHVSPSRANTITSTGGGDWYSTTPDAPWPGGTVPAAGDDAIITGNVRPDSAAVTINNLTIGGSATFFNSHTVNVTGNLNLSGTAKVQQGAALTIGGNLDLASGTTYDVSSAPVTVGGSTTVSGTLKDGSNDGALTDLFGDVTVMSGGTWALSDVVQWSVSGNLVNNGNITATSGGITFTGSGKSISGNATSIPKLAVEGTLQNQVTLTVSTALTGGGTLSQAVGTTLSIGAGTVTLAALNAAAIPNTVNYSGAAQTVVNGTYHNLNLSGSGIKTFGDATINADLTVASPVRARVTGTVSVTGATTVNFGAFLAGSGTVNGSVIVSGTIAPGTLAPGNVIGTLTLGSQPNLGGGAIAMDINRASSPNADQLLVNGSPLAFAGTLAVNNTGAALQAGDSFQLFSASAHAGTFSLVTLPVLGANLAWTNKLAVDGSIAVISTGGGSGPVLNISRSGGDLTLTWDPATFPGYLLQSAPSANGIHSTGNTWGNLTAADASPFTATINPGGPPVFYRLIK